MSIFKFIGINLFFFFFISSFSYASPTSNEFIPCNKIAVSLLQQCLTDKGSSCWLTSKSQYESCRKQVFDSHRLGSKRIKAATKRAEEIRRATREE